MLRDVRGPARSFAVAGSIAGLVVLAACSTPTSPTPGSELPASGAASTSTTRSADPDADPTAATAGPTATTSDGADVSCARPQPTQLRDLDLGPERALEAVAVTSASGALTTGRRVRSASTVPALTGPDGTAVSGGALIRDTANLLSAQRSLRLVMERPAAPEIGLRADRPPLDRPGTYVVFLAARSVSAAVDMTCGGARQDWRLTGDTDLVLGRLACTRSATPAPESALAADLRSELC